MTYTSVSVDNWGVVVITHEIYSEHVRHVMWSDVLTEYMSNRWGMSTPFQTINRGDLRCRWCIWSPWYIFFPSFSFSLFYWLIFIIHLHNEDVRTPPLPPQWMGLETQRHLVPPVFFFFFFDKQQQQPDAAWGVEYGLEMHHNASWALSMFFFLLVVVAFSV